MQMKKLNIFEKKEVKSEWLTTKEVTETYVIGESTLYYWRAKGIIKIWKKSSTSQVTVYSARELDKLFSPVEKLKPNKNRKKTELMLAKQKERLGKTTKSDEELVAEYFRKQELKKRKETYLKEADDWDELTKQRIKPNIIKTLSPKKRSSKQNIDTRKVHKGYCKNNKRPMSLKEIFGNKK